MGQHVWRAQLRNVWPTAPDFPTGAEITLAGGVKLSVNVGKFGVRPGTASLPRRIQIADLDGDKSLLVSDFDGEGKNLVSIDFDETDTDSEGTAMLFANSIVSCHLSSRGS